MLPTPDTSHVSYSRVYEPAEDSFLLLDTLSSASETAFLRSRFSHAQPPTPSTSASQPSPTLATTTTTPTPTPPPPPPLILEVGTGSGVVLAFLTAQARPLFGHTRVLSAGVDVNPFACAATAETVRKAVSSSSSHGSAAPAGAAGQFLDVVRADLAAPLRPGLVDVLVFNPPYVPTAEMPSLPAWDDDGCGGGKKQQAGAASEEEQQERLLELSYAGGRDGMETTDRLVDGLPGLLSARGCAYVLLCARNGPEAVKDRIRGFGPAWRAETVGTSGRTAGWERLQVVRIWREGHEG